MRAAATALAAAALLGAPAVPLARADAPRRIEVPKSQLRLELPPGWEDVDAPEGSLRAWEAEGARLVLTRMDFPNRDAWRGKERFFREVEEGIRGRTDGYRRIRRRRHRIGPVPGLDLWFRRRAGDGPPVVLSRFLFFRRYTVVLSVGMTREAFQKRARRREARRVLRSFRPYLGD